jgi:hypothetical protein
MMSVPTQPNFDVNNVNNYNIKGAAAAAVNIATQQQEEEENIIIKGGI